MALQLVFNSKVVPAANYTPKSAGGWYFQNLLLVGSAAPAASAPPFTHNMFLNNLMRF